jgi:glycosyltransferase involved in cell wall biosynthesis
MNILIGIPVKNTGKYLDNLFNQLINLDYDKSLITVVLLEGDSNDDSYEVCRDIKDKYNGVVTTILDKLDLGFNLNHSFERHYTSNLPNRIKNLVICRNYIVDNYLKNNSHIWWVDSDFEVIPPYSLKKFIEHDKDIIIPFLTHTKWGYHDCGSYGTVNGEKVRMFYMNQYIKNETIFKLDQADAHCFIKRRVFDSGLRYRHVEEQYVDMCGTKMPVFLEGPSFSRDAIKMGFEVWGSSDIIIHHHNV